MTWLPGTAERLAESLRLVPQPLYGPAGSQVYHQLSRDDRHEIAGVLDVLADTVGPVLELGCGSGRLTLPLALRGFPVTGLDLSAAMLVLLTSRLAEVDYETVARVRTVIADMTSFALGERFAAVVLGAGSICLLDDAEREALYDRVREHLAPGGIFLVSVTDFADQLAGGGQPVERMSVGVLPSGRPGEPEVRLTMIQYFSPAEGRRATSVLREPVVDGVVGAGELFTSTVRLLSAAQVHRELEHHGFEVCPTLLARGGQDGESVAKLLSCRLRAT
ncbi:daptide-type RiPP biosynthesis methyltransferase [Amycolatopsis lurida]